MIMNFCSELFSGLFYAGENRARALLIIILLCFLGFALSAHIFSFLAVILRRAQICGKKNSAAESDGVSVLCPVTEGKDGAELWARSLESAFAAAHQPKEIIIFSAAAPASAQNLAENSRYEMDIADTIRKIRTAHMETPSLLIAAESGAASDSAADAVSAREQRQSGNLCLVKAWQSARYDFIFAAAANVILPPNLLEQCFRLWRKGQKKTRMQQKTEESVKTALFTAAQTGSVCACLWAVIPQGFRPRLAAAFLNSWWTRRLLAAENFGCAVAQSGAQFWHYDIMSAAGGIKAFIAAAETKGENFAAGELVCRAGRKIRLTALPLALPLQNDAALYTYLRSQAGDINSRRERGRKKRRFRGITPHCFVLAEQVACLRLYRRFLPRSFFAEPFLGVFMPFAAAAAACWRGLFPLTLLFAFCIIWYGAEYVFLWIFEYFIYKKGIAAGAGETVKGHLKQIPFLLLRDALLPFLWFYAALFPKNKASAKTET